MRATLFLGVLALLSAGCGSLVSPPLPPGWQRYGVNDPPISIGAPPGWGVEASDDGDELLFLSIPDPDPGFATISRVEGAPTSGDDWLAWYVGEKGFPPGVLDDEWLELPAGRASHGLSRLGDFYLLQGPDGSVIIIMFFDTRFENEAQVGRNRAVAETFRFESQP